MKQPTRPSERGAILIFVAVTIVALMAFAAFVIDYGVFWMSRAQAQNAADAGALAGAAALATQDNAWPIPAGGAVEATATATAGQNFINSAAGVAQVSSTCPGYLVSPFNTNCIQVDVYRDGEFSSATLPTYFAHLFNVSSQGTRATATAQVAQANGTGCMRPWFIPDKTPSYCAANCGAGMYDIGTMVTFHGNTAPSSYGQLDAGSGAKDLAGAIRYCMDGTFKIGDTVATEPGKKKGPVTSAIDDVISWDPDAFVVYSPSGCTPGSTCTSAIVTGGCAATGTCKCPDTGAECPYGATMSPRIVHAAICDPIAQPDCGADSGKGSITITNILSFFILGTSGGNPDIDAVIISSSGDIVSGGGPVAPGNSFLTAIRLVR